MASEFLSLEEENYVRMSLLLTGISPRAVRVLFDCEFAPKCLYSSLKKEYNKLSELKRQHIISHTQWNRLFPPSSGVPDSNTFDITLMIALLRNLTTLTPPAGGYDILPTRSETTPGADLARLKFYRNRLAHLDDAKIDHASFITDWNDVTSGILRIGGYQFQLECDNLKTKHLDQTSHDIMLEIKSSNDEIRKLKQSLKRLKKQIDISQQNPLPMNIRAQVIKKLEKWKNQDKMFINTRAAQHVFKCVKMQSCVTITASSGVGKTATLRHVALLMAGEGYEVLPLADPSDIVKLHNPNKETLIVIDDFCGKYSVNQTNIHIWESVIDDIEEIIENKKTKIIVACRLQVYQDNKFDLFSIFKSCVCNMLSDSICLLKPEKQSIAEVYLESEACKIVEYYDLYDCFPLLCKCYHVNPTLSISDFFQNPILVYEEEVEKLHKKGYFGKYCALALCVIFNNSVPEDILTEDIDEDTRTIIENTCEACKLDKGTSRRVLKDELDSLLQSFLKKEHGVYQSINDKIFVFLAYCFGQKIINCLIKNAHSCFIKERFVLESHDCVDQFITVIPERYHDLYLRRMIDDWSKGKVQDVVCNSNMKLPKFKDQFLCHLNILDKSYQKQLVHTKDIYNTDTPLLQCCLEGDISLTKWCCELGADINQCRPNGESPLIIACEQGHAEIVRILLEKGVDYNKFDKWERSPVVIACKNGYTEIFRILDKNGVIYDKCNRFNRSPLMIASEHGYTEIVKMLLEQGADYNKCNNDGQSSLIIACEHGHEKIIELLLASGAKYNECNKWGQSPLMVACKYGHKEIVQNLLDRGVDYNKCNHWDESPLMSACEKGYTEIVKMLLDRGADCSNTFDKLGKSPVWIACRYGHIEILKILLDKGADYSTRDSENRSPLLITHKNGYKDMAWILVQKTVNDNKCKKISNALLIIALTRYPTDIVKMFLKSGVDYTICDSTDRSPLLVACEHGHIEIVCMLMHKGEDFDKCDIKGQSPVMMAYKRGHTEIVRIMIAKGADFNKCDKNGQSLVSLTCQHGNTEVLRMLLDKGADCYTFDRDGQSPALVSVYHGHTDIVKMIVENKSNRYHCDKNGQSLVLVACKNGHTEIVRLLLYSGANFDKCDNNDMSPLLKACQKGHTEIVSILLNSGADYKKCDDNDLSPLLIACQKGHKEIVRLLLISGADYNKCNNNDLSPLSIACQKGHKEIVKILLDSGANYDKCDNNDVSPLSIACENGRTEIVVLLLSSGADYNKCNNNDMSPLSIACKKGHTDIVKILLYSGADYDKCDNNDMSPLLIACQYGYTVIVRMLLDKGADLNKCDKNGRSPVWISCCAQYQMAEIMIRMLLKKGAECNKCEQSLFSLHALNSDILLDGNVPFCLCHNFMYIPIKTEEHRYKESCRQSLDNRSDLNICDDNGLSPLMIACVYGNGRTVRLLLDGKADYNHFDIFGRSSVFLACHFGHIEIVKMLIAEGADYDYCDLYGLTPLQTAKKRNFRDIYTLLVEMKKKKPRKTIRKCIKNLKTRFTIEDEVLYSRANKK